MRSLAPADCGFTYRSSAFKREPGRWVVLAVRFALEASERSAPIRYAELARALGVEVGARAPSAEVREAVLALRRGKGMVLDPDDADTVSAGSFFTNPVLDAGAFAALQARAAQRLGPDVRPPAWPQDDGEVKTSAAWLIERAGFHRGHGNPEGIAISAKHTLALTNRGAGTTAELVALAREIADGVQDGLRGRARARAGVRRARWAPDVGQAWPRADRGDRGRQRALQEREQRLAVEAAVAPLVERGLVEVEVGAQRDARQRRRAGGAEVVERHAGDERVAVALAQRLDLGLGRRAGVAPYEPGVARASGVLDRALGVGGEPLGQRLARIDDEVAGQLVAGALQRGEEHVQAPAREVVVEQVARHPGALGDVVERQPGVALLGRDGEGRPHELGAPLRGRQPPRNRWSHWSLTTPDLGIFTICQVYEL